MTQVQRDHQASALSNIDIIQIVSISWDQSFLLSIMLSNYNSSTVDFPLSNGGAECQNSRYEHNDFENTNDQFYLSYCYLELNEKKTYPYLIFSLQFNLFIISTCSPSYFSRGHKKFVGVLSMYCSPLYPFLALHDH